MMMMMMMMMTTTLNFRLPCGRIVSNTRYKCYMLMISDQKPSTH